KLVAGIDKDIGFTLIRLNLSGVCSSFQATNARGSHSDHTFTCGFGCLNQIANLLAHVHDLTVHGMLGDFIHTNRLKSACANVESNKPNLNTLLAQLFEQLIIKVQSGGRCCYSSLLTAVYGLIAFAILLYIIAI